MKYEVHLHWDGPVFSDDATITVEADDEADAYREAVLYAGMPKIGGIRLAGQPQLAAEISR